MADLNKPELIIELEFTGERARVEEYTIESDYLQHADSWSCTVYNHSDPAALRRKWRPLQPVKLYLDGALQIVGRIGATEGAGESGAALRIEGRDYVGDLVDGGADPSIHFAQGTQLGDAVLDLLRPYGITTLFGNFNLTRNIITGKSITAAAPPKDFGAARLSDFKIEDNQGALEATNKIVSRHGFTIQPVMRRDALAITEPQYGQPASYGISRPGNILSAKARRDYENIPTVTIATGRVSGGLPTSPLTGAKGEYPTFGLGSPNEIGRLDDVKRVVFGDGTEALMLMSRFLPGGEGVAGNAGLRYAPLFYSDKKARTVEELERGIRKVIGDRAKNALTYTCTVRGHRDPETDTIYCVDTIASIDDRIEDVRQDMWLQSRTLTNSGGGPETKLSFTLPGAIAL